MAKKRLSPRQKRELRDQVLGLIVVEVVDVANRGLQPINQTDVIDRIKKRRGGKKLSSSTVSKYVNERLRTKVTGRVWLKSETGQRLELQSEDGILRDSKMIRALLSAKRIADREGRFVVSAWMSRCSATSDSAEVCQGYLDEFGKCGYTVNGIAGRGRAQLDLARLNQDMFYLRQAKDAGLRYLRRRPATPQ